MNTKWRGGLLAAALILILVAGLALAQGRQGNRVIDRFMTGSSYLGIEMDEVTADNMATYKLGAERGVIVRSVQKGSPAADAEIHEKDVITDYDGMPVLSTMQLSRLVQETPAGRKVGLGVSREGKKVNLTAKIGKRDGPVLLRSDGWQSGPMEREFQFGPEGRAFRFEIPNGQGPFAFSLPPGRGEGFESRPLLGVTLQPLTEQMAEFLGVTGKRGALVTSVNEGSPAATAKLRAGDVVVRAGDRAIEDPQDLARAVERAAGEKLDLKVVRDKREITVTVELPKESRNTRGFRL